MKLPSFQFYPGDWMKDPNLRRCTKAERGMWIDMLCLMFECKDRGVLAGDEPWTDQEIAGAVGGDISEGCLCISELLRKGVAHRNSFGAIFSKRMVRDEQIRQARVKAGSLGGANAQANRKQHDKQKRPPSASSSLDSPLTPQNGGNFGNGKKKTRKEIADETARRKAIEYLNNNPQPSGLRTDLTREIESAGVWTNLEEDRQEVLIAHVIEKKRF